MTKEKIAKFLKQLRKTSGLSAQEVVEELRKYGVQITSEKTLYGYENEKNEKAMPNADAFVYLCKIYKCDNPMDMFEPSHVSPEDLEFLRDYHFLDDFGKETVDIILSREVERVKQINELTSSGESSATDESEDYLMPNAAHARTDIPQSEDVDTSDDDVFKKF